MFAAYVKSFRARETREVGEALQAACWNEEPNRRTVLKRLRTSRRGPVSDEVVRRDDWLNAR